MQKGRKLLIFVIASVICIPLLLSCKKGDGDPFFSMYTRKARLTGDWKVGSMTQTVMYKTTTVTTTYDGSKKTVELVVPDTTVYSGNDTLYQYVMMQTFTGTIAFTFDKEGVYQVDEAFTDDTTSVQYTSQERGLWFFTGGGRDSDTQAKELLGLQPTSFVYNPLSPDTYSITYTGQNEMAVYHIYKLASKEIELRIKKSETINLFTISSELQMVLEPR